MPLSLFLFTHFLKRYLQIKVSKLCLFIKLKSINFFQNSFLDTNLTSFGSTRKPPGIGLRVAKRIEKTDLISASFMMLCLISIVVYGNAD
jgi:hypothetical protein